MLAVESTSDRPRGPSSRLASAPLHKAVVRLYVDVHEVNGISAALVLLDIDLVLRYYEVTDYTVYWMYSRARLFAYSTCRVYIEHTIWDSFLYESERRVFIFIRYSRFFSDMFSRNEGNPIQCE